MGERDQERGEGRGERGEERGEGRGRGRGNKERERQQKLNFHTKSGTVTNEIIKPLRSHDHHTTPTNTIYI